VIHANSIVHLLNTTDGKVQERTHYGIQKSDKRFLLMLKGGCNKQGGLGTEGKGQTFPVKTRLKNGRTGLDTGERKGLEWHIILEQLIANPAAFQRQPKPGDRKKKQSTVKRKEQAKMKSKGVFKEIEYRRELGSL